MTDYVTTTSLIYPASYRPRETGALIAAQEYAIETLTERLAALELALEDLDWTRMVGQAEQEFSRDGLRTICELARVMYLKNPIINRGVNVQRDYVFGQGVSVRGEQPGVDEVVQAFWNDALNQAELTSNQAMRFKEVDLAVEANLFFVFFTRPSDGRTRVRSIPFGEVVSKITNPEDKRQTWFYLRNWVEQQFDASSQFPTMVSRQAYYPDWRYVPAVKPPQIGSVPVMWHTPVYHVKVGGFSWMDFGVSEVYAAIDWAKAYKQFLEDWATIVRAYSRFAFQLTTNGGKNGIAAAKTKMASTAGSTGVEGNPAPAAASTFIASPNTKLEPIRTSGATVSAEDGRRLLLMVAASLGLPETFFGDAQAGTLATAKSLDRPTELKFVSRQALWKDIFGSIFYYLVYQAVKAGKIAGVIEEDDDGVPNVKVLDENGTLVEPNVLILFPPVLEHDATAAVSAVVSAATLQGYQRAGTIDDKTLVRMLMNALGETDTESVIQALYPSEPSDGAGALSPVEREYHQAANELRQVVRKMREALHGG